MSSARGRADGAIGSVVDRRPVGRDSALAAQSSSAPPGWAAARFRLQGAGRPFVDSAQRGALAGSGRGVPLTRHLLAAGLISNGDTIVLTSGTTTNQVARSIPAGLQVTAVTSTVNVAMELCNRRGVSVFVTGGFLHGGWFPLVGATAMQALSSIFPDKAFIGANGVHPDHGVTAYHSDEAALNNVMVRQSREKIVVADHSKLGVVTTHLICPLGEIDLIITDSGAEDEAIAGFVQKGIEVRRV